MKDLNQQEWKAATAAEETLVILDVRTPGEVEQGIIPGAKVSDIFQQEEFVKTLEAMDKDVPTYVYCRSGGRSAKACELMDAMGFKETYNLVGGFSEWTGEVA